MKSFLRLCMVLSFALIAAVVAGAVRAQVPPQALEHLPVLRQAQLAAWPDAPMPAFLGAQVEQESCITLKHSKCWNPRVELKTKREYGFGLGQFTIAYRDDGSVRFNKWAEMRAKYPSLRGWTWENRFDPGYQLTAMVELDKSIYRLWPDSATAHDRLGFTLSGYNGGEGHVRQDRLLCRNTRGCDPARWFGHVEHHSVKSRVPFKGYGKSPYEINREYPRNVLGFRMPKYQPFFREQ